MKRKIITVLLLLCVVTSAKAGDEWFRAYAKGVQAMKAEKYEIAVEEFEQALKEKRKDTKRIRTYGMHFIKYFPNRELGIAYYNLGRKQKALFHLKLSAKMEPTAKAEKYLALLKGVVIDDKKDEKTIVKDKMVTPVPAKNEPTNEMIVGKKTIQLVGERMSVAVLPFENKGASKDLGEIVLDKMITALFNQGRFKVIERTQLDKILQEQQLGMAGVVDASTAAEIGKGIGVDAIIMGSVAAEGSGAFILDARAIDTESATIIVADDAYSGNADALSVKNAVENLANKITQGLPLVEGIIIGVNPDKSILLDVGRVGGIKKGMKCVVYQEGPEFKHPITGKSLGRQTKIIAEVLITESLDKFSTAKVTNDKSGMQISIGDKFLTK